MGRAIAMRARVNREAYDRNKRQLHAGSGNPTEEERAIVEIQQLSRQAPNARYSVRPGHHREASYISQRFRFPPGAALNGSYRFWG